MLETEIVDIRDRTVFDSRGVETLEVDLFTRSGFARVAAPFGAPGSRGEFEAPAYAPGGLYESVHILRNEITPSIVGMDAAKQSEIDHVLEEVDGTPNFERIGGNTATIVSTAIAIAAADSLKLPLFQLLGAGTRSLLPVPLGNIVGGGAHSLGPAPDMQEHMVVPVGARSARHAIEINLKVHRQAGLILEKRNIGFAGGMDDEDAWAADLNDAQALDIVETAKKMVEDEEGVEIRLGIDLAADRLWHAESGQYIYSREDARRDPSRQLHFVLELIERFDLSYVEDAFESNDYESFSLLNNLSGDRCTVCADDIFATNYERTQIGLAKGSAGAMIIKPNQVGTLTGAMDTARLASDHGLKVIVSNRSGETPDVSIAHLAVALSASGIKAGVRGGARIIKLNELLRIEDSLEHAELSKWHS